MKIRTCLASLGRRLDEVGLWPDEVGRTLISARNKHIFPKIKMKILYKISVSLLLALPLISLAAMATVNFFNAIEGIFKIIGTAAGLIGLAFFALGIFRFVTSKGDPKILNEAKVNIVWAIIAVLIAAALFNMTAVLAYFGITLITE